MMLSVYVQRPFAPDPSFKSCPKCGFYGNMTHINTCDGTAVMCDVPRCGHAIKNDYNCIYIHYRKAHGMTGGGKNGGLLKKFLKPKSEYKKPEPRKARKRRMCPQCHLPSNSWHRRSCKGDAVACDLPLCGIAIHRTYFAIMRHYKTVHKGQFGNLLSTVKPPTRKGNRMVTIDIQVPSSQGIVRCIYHRTAKEWDALAKQGHVWDTKDINQFALSCAIATYQLQK